MHVFTKHLASAVLAIGLAVIAVPSLAQAAPPEGLIQPVQYYRHGYYRRGYYPHRFYGGGYYHRPYFRHGPGFYRRGYYGRGYRY